MQPGAWPPWRYIHHHISELFRRNQDPTQSLQAEHRFLEPRPATSPPANQKTVTRPDALTPNFAIKHVSPKTVRGFRVFEYEPPILRARPCLQ